MGGFVAGVPSSSLKKICSSFVHTPLLAIKGSSLQGAAVAESSSFYALVHVSVSKPTPCSPPACKGTIVMRALVGLFALPLLAGAALGQACGPVASGAGLLNALAQKRCASVTLAGQPVWCAVCDHGWRRGAAPGVAPVNTHPQRLPPEACCR